MWMRLRDESFFLVVLDINVFLGVYGRLLAIRGLEKTAATSGSAFHEGLLASRVV